MTDSDIPEQQRNVQRLLGRCLVRLQQYEKLMKSLVAHHEIKGPAHELEQIRAQRADDLATTSLGSLVKSLLGSYIVADETDHAPFDDKTTPKDISSIAIRSNLRMSALNYAQTKAALKDLVMLRNNLVHHFIDQFDILTVDGCTAAGAYLKECYTRIDRHVEQLRSWANGMEQARALLLAFTETQEFTDFVINGIAPDGTIEWPIAGIICGLREAATQLSMGGWTKLDDAVAFIAERDPEQTPLKYGCRSWRQVLNESRIFELQYRRDECDSRIPWFKERGR